jgi:hypothetical protein
MIDKFIEVMAYVCGIGAFLLGLVFVWLVISFFAGIPCSVKAKAQSLEYKYGVVMGCMVKYKGEWVDYDRLRYVE